MKRFCLLSTLLISLCLLLTACGTTTRSESAGSSDSSSSTSSSSSTKSSGSNNAIVGNWVFVSDDIEENVTTVRCLAFREDGTGDYQQLNYKSNYFSPKRGHFKYTYEDDLLNFTYFELGQKPLDQKIMPTATINDAGDVLTIEYKGYDYQFDRTSDSLQEISEYYKSLSNT